MEKQLFEEALADVKLIKEAAMSEAQAAVVEAVVPRIKELIEQELLAESTLGESDDSCDDKDVDVLNDDASCDDAVVEEKTEDPLRVDRDVDGECDELAENVRTLAGASRIIKETLTYGEKVSKLIARVEDMYEYVHEMNSARKNVIEQKLERLYTSLNEIQETVEMAKSKKRLNEDDVTVTLSGLPDGVDLDQVGVDLISDEEENEEGEGAVDDVDLGEEPAGEDEELDLDGLDLDAAEGDDEAADDVDEEEPVEEAAECLSDDTVVEIDESMLRREIAKMKMLREAAETSTVVDEPAVDFDDGEDEVDVDLSDLDLSDLDDEEIDVDLSDLDPTPDSLNQKLALETRLLARSRARLNSIKEAAHKARLAHALKVEAKLRQSFKAEKASELKLVESINRIKGSIAKSKRPVNEARVNRALKAPAENRVNESLRQQLAETNLQNMKLLCANKLLQNGSLSNRQKAQVVESINKAATPREVKALYEGIMNTLAPKSLDEGTKVLGTASRPTRSGAAPASALNESAGFDLDRWQKLAGIK